MRVLIDYLLTAWPELTPQSCLDFREMVTVLTPACSAVCVCCVCERVCTLVRLCAQVDVRISNKRVSCGTFTTVGRFWSRRNVWVIYVKLEKTPPIPPFLLTFFPSSLLQHCRSGFVWSRQREEGGAGFFFFAVWCRAPPSGLLWVTP